MLMMLMMLVLLFFQANGKDYNQRVKGQKVKLVRSRQRRPTVYSAHAAYFRIKVGPQALCWFLGYLLTIFNFILGLHV